MYRFTVALALVIASATASSAQTWRPTIWQSERGAIIKVLSIDPATGNFSGILISSPTGACPSVRYDMTGHVRAAQRRAVFTASNTWSSDCRGTVVWSARAIDPGTAAVKWVSKSAGPNGQVVTRRGTEIFKRL
jgi:hypothetical protein